MIRLAARKYLSGRCRGLPSSVHNALGGATSSRPPSKRLMSSSIPPSDVGGTDGFPSVDESLGNILPSFGSTPISPEIDSATTTIDSATIAEQIAAFEPTWWPSDHLLVLINWVNESAGLPCYAYSIGATTLALRFLLFPIFVKGQSSSSRMAHLQPELKIMKEELDKMGKGIDVQAQRQYTQQTVALFRKYNCNPLVSIAAPLASMPVFMSMFFAMRSAPDQFPDLLSTGGMLWFPDLTAADPYCIMPVLSAVTFLGMTEVGKEGMMAQDPAKGRIMVNTFRALAIVMVPMTMNFSSSIFCYWTVNNTFSLMQTVLLKQPAAKKAFGIWDPPKPVPGQEPKSIFDEVKNLINKNKKKEDPNACAVDRVKAHNEIIAQQKVVQKKLMEKERFRRRNRK